KGASSSANACSGFGPAAAPLRLAGRDEGRGNEGDQRRRQDEGDVVPPPDGHDAADRSAGGRLAGDTPAQQSGRGAPSRHFPLPPGEARHLPDSHPSLKSDRQTPSSHHAASG